nr:MAG TPA: hypothetical protein [Caudoviricetes sp.]
MYSLILDIYKVFKVNNQQKKGRPHCGQSQLNQESAYSSSLSEGVKIQSDNISL